METIASENYQAYDEGLGRSMWYTVKGDVTKVTEMVRSFPADRHADLWRGVGIACSYVGGFDKEILDALVSASAEHNVQLAIGAAMVAKSRIEAECITEDIETSCHALCNTTAQQAMDITNRNKRVPNFSFSKFILDMYNELSATKNIK